MPAPRSLLAGVALLLLGVLAAVWLVPPQLNWDRYRNDIAMLASAALGQQVRIDGKIALRVLPEPVLVAERVAVVEGAGGVSVTAQELQLRVALGPLLAGRVDARDLVLRGADIRLPWPLDPGTLAVRLPVWLPALSARLEDGRLRLGDVEFNDIDATLTTGDFAGSLFSAGRAKFGKHVWVFTARVGAPGGDGAVGLDLTLDGQGAMQGIGTVVSGQIQPDGTMLGRIAARGPDLAALMPAPPLAFRTEGRLSVGGGLVAADELVGEIGGSPVKGAVALRLAPLMRLDIALAASRFDLDAWLPALLLGRETGLYDRMPVGIDLSAEAAPLAGGILRDLRAGLDMAPGIVTLREARATLPGDAVLRLGGRLGARPAAPPRFEGQASLAAPALRATLGWAAAAGMALPGTLPPGVLRNAELAADIAIEPGDITLSRLAGRVDGTAVAGSIGWRVAPRPALRATLSLDRWIIDPWLPAALPPWRNLAGALATALTTTLGGAALDLQLDARLARIGSVELSPLLLDVAAEPARLTLRRLELQGLGASLTATATMQVGGRVEEAKLDLRAAQASGLAELLPAAAKPLAAGLQALLRGELTLTAQAVGPPEALAVRLAGTIGDLRFEAAPTIDIADGRAAGAIALRHPGAPRLVEMLGLQGAPAWLGDGSFGLVAQVIATPGRLAADNFDLVAGGLRVGGSLSLENGAVPRLAGRLAAETLPLPFPYARSPDPLPIDALAGWEATLRLEARRVLVVQTQVLEDAAATLALSGGVLRLDGLTARMGGGALTAKAVFDTAARPPALTAEAGLRSALVAMPLLDLPIDLTAGTIDMVASLKAVGFAPAGLLASLAGELRLVGRDGVLDGIGMAAFPADLPEPVIRAALSAGTTPFDQLEIIAPIRDGGLTLARAALAGAAGTITATGSIDLTRAVLALRLALVPAIPDAPEIGLRLDGPIDEVERIPELAALARWRAERGR